MKNIQSFKLKMKMIVALLLISQVLTAPVSEVFLSIQNIYFKCSTLRGDVNQCVNLRHSKFRFFISTLKIPGFASRRSFLHGIFEIISLTN